MFKKETFISVDYNDLEDLIHKTYGIKNYEMIAAEEWNNDSQHRIRIKKNEKLYDWDVENFEKWKSAQTSYEACDISLRLILIDMCKQGIIEEGTYLVTVSW